jgi:hypothetical protein
MLFDRVRIVHDSSYSALSIPRIGLPMVDFGYYSHRYRAQQP